MQRLAEPPRRIVTERLLLRPYEAATTRCSSRTQSTRASTICGRSWTGRGRRRSRRPCSARRLRDFRRLFDHGDDWIYGIFTLDGSELIGGGGLHRRVGAEALEIGYWIRASRVRQGLATEAAARADAGRVRALRRHPDGDPRRPGERAAASRSPSGSATCARRCCASACRPMRPGSASAGTRSCPRCSRRSTRRRRPRPVWVERARLAHVEIGRPAVALAPVRVGVPGERRAVGRRGSRR